MVQLLLTLVVETPLKFIKLIAKNCWDGAYPAGANICKSKSCAFLNSRLVWILIARSEYVLNQIKAFIDPSSHEFYFTTQLL